MKRAVCFYSRVLFLEHPVFELYSHSALGQCLVSDASQFPLCNCISQPWTKTQVIFTSSIECFSQDCVTLCHQGNSHATLLADMPKPFCLGPSRCFLPAFSPGRSGGQFSNSPRREQLLVILTLLLDITMGKSDLEKNQSSSELCSGMVLSVLLMTLKVKQELLLCKLFSVCQRPFESCFYRVDFAGLAAAGLHIYQLAFLRGIIARCSWMLIKLESTSL